MTSQRRVITLSGTGSDISKCEFPRIELGDQRYEVGLVSLETRNTEVTVREGQNRFYFYPKVRNAEKEYTESQTGFFITVPEGSYSVADIYKYLVAHFVPMVSLDTWRSKVNYFNIYTSSITHKIIVETSIRIDFSVDYSIGPLLGYTKELRPELSPTLLTVVTFKQDSKAKLLQDRRVFVCCNLVGEQGHALYSFTVHAEPGQPIVEKPPHVIYHTVDRQTISDISVQLQTQEGKLLQLHRDTPVTVTLHLKPA